MRVSRVLTSTLTRDISANSFIAGPRDRRSNAAAQRTVPRVDVDAYEKSPRGGSEHFPYIRILQGFERGSTCNFVEQIVGVFIKSDVAALPWPPTVPGSPAKWRVACAPGRTSALFRKHRFVVPLLRGNSPSLDGPASNGGVTPASDAFESIIETPTDFQANLSSATRRARRRAGPDDAGAFPRRRHVETRHQGNPK